MFEQNEQSNLTDSMIVPGSDAMEEFCVDLTSPWGLLDGHPQSFAVAASYQVTASGKRSLGFALAGLPSLA